MTTLFDRVAVFVSSVEVGTMLPIADCLGGDLEVRGATNVHQRCFVISEDGVTPLAITRRDEVDMITIDLPSRIRLGGSGHRIQCAAAGHEPISTTAA